VKARTVTVRPSLGASVSVVVVAIAAYAALPPWRFSWWPFAAITVAALILLLVRVRRHSSVTWVAARVRHRRTRRYTTPVGAAVDIRHGNEVYGVRTAGNEAVAVIRVDGHPYEPTFLRGSTVAHTVNVLPLDVLVQFLDQPGGLRIGFDIASDGFRVRPESGYPQLYSTLLAARGAAGQRVTYLIVRLDIRESLPGLVYRQSIGTAVAAAADRVIKALQQEGVRAVALTAEEQDAVLGTLSLGLAAPPPRPAVVEPHVGDDDDDEAPDAVTVASENVGKRRRRRRLAGAAAELDDPDRKLRAAVDVHWTLINAQPGYVTSYYFSPEDISTDTFNQMWALPSDHVLHVLMLRKQGDDVVVSAIVRTNDPRPPKAPPTLFLNTLPGEQYTAALRAAPVSTPSLPLPARPLTADLEIAVGSTGVLVGAALRDDKSGRPEVRCDDLVMWALTDPQRPTRITMGTSDFYVRQLLIRAAATGERIAIFSRDPRRWYSVSQPNIAVMEPGRRAEFVPTIIVNDHAAVAPPMGLASTVITVGRVTDATPDILFQQTSPSTVRVQTGARMLELAIVEFIQEQTWTGSAA
jgi:type VII secretion protein EccE